MPDVIKALLGSTRFWAVVIMAVVPILNRKLGLELDPQEIIAILSGAATYVVGQSIRSTRASYILKFEPVEQSSKAA